MNTQIRTINVAVGNEEAFEKRIKLANRHAKRLGYPEITVDARVRTSVERTIIEVFEGNERHRKSMHEVTAFDLVVPVDHVEWSPVGRIEQIDGKTFVDIKRPGINAKDHENRNPCNCDHCGVNRQRNFTFLLQNSSTKEFKQVGRSCVEAFLGKNGLHRLEFQEILISILDEEEKDTFGGSDRIRGMGGTVEPREVIAYALALEEENGWANNTRDDWGVIIKDGTHRQAALKVGEGKASDEMIAPKLEEADRIIETILNLEIDEKDDFASSLQYCLRFDLVPAQKGFLIGYASRYLVNKAEKEAREAKKATMRHIGEPKQKMECELTLVREHSFDTQYGLSTFYTFNDRDGNEIVWKTGSDVSFPRDEYFTAKFTVKDHTEWNGMPQTNVLRLKVIEQKSLTAA